MFQSRSQKHIRHSNKKFRRSLRLTVIFLSIGVLFLCLYTFWDKFLQDELEINSLEQPSITQVNTDDTKEHADTTVGDSEESQNNADLTTDNGESEASPRVRFAFTGDIMLGSNVDKLMRKNGFDYPYLHVSSLLNDADLTAVNLENPITERGEPFPNKDWVFRASPDAVPEVVNSGIDILNLANNHSMDYGLLGLQDTIRLLSEAGLHSVGAGKNEEEAYTPIIIEKNGVRVAFLGFSQVIFHVSMKADKAHPGIAETYDYTRPVKAIKSAREQADIVIVMVHWGQEGTTKLETIQTELAHRYVDAGADLIIGSHPHVLQGIERYKNKWIAYSLGNFIFTTNGKSGSGETAILQANCDQSAECQLKIIPLWTGSAQPTPMEDAEAQVLYQHLTDISFGVQVQEDGNVIMMRKEESR